MDWWPGDGNANDIAGTNNGTLVAGAMANTNGVVGNAFHFNGTNDYVQFPDSPNFHPTNFTVEMWVKFDKLDTPHTDSYAGEEYLFFKQNSHSGGFEGLAVMKARSLSAGGIAPTSVNGDIFQLLVTSTNAQNNYIEAYVMSATTITNGIWYHVVALRNTNLLQLYVNGVLEAQTNVNFPQDYGTLPLYFGTTGQSYWDAKFSGSLDEVAFYNRALSANEIAAIYQAGNAGKCKSAANVRLGMYPGRTAGLAFSGMAGKTYGVQISTNLVSTNFWRGLTNLTLTTPTNLWYDAQLATQKTRFYRVLNGPITIP